MSEYIKGTLPTRGMSVYYFLVRLRKSTGSLAGLPGSQIKSTYGVQNWKQLIDDHVVKTGNQGELS